MTGLFTRIGLLLLAVGGLSVAQTEKVVFVQMDPSEDIAYRDAYQAQYDGQRVELNLPASHPLLHLADYIGKEPIVYNSECMDPLLRGCFRPEMKIIYRDYTYVVGNHFAHAIRYKNDAPYTAGARMVPLDFLFTKTTLMAANDVRDQQFERSYAVYFKQLGTPALVAHSEAYKAKLAKALQPPATTTASATTTTGTTTAGTTTTTGTTGSTTATGSTTGTTTTASATTTGTTVPATAEEEDLELEDLEDDLEISLDAPAEEKLTKEEKAELDAVADEPLDLNADLNMDMDLDMDMDVDVFEGDDESFDIDLDEELDADLDLGDEF